MSGERLHELSPEEKNEVLFALHVRDLAEKLKGKEIARLDEPQQKIKVDVTVAYGKKEEGVEEVGNNPMYKSQHDRQPGEVTIIDWKFRKTKLFLVNADGEDPATCIRIQKGSIYNPEKEVYEQLPLERDVSEYLQLLPNIIYKLSYQKPSEILSADTLYLEEIEDISLSSEDANSALKNLRNS